MVVLEGTEDGRYACKGTAVVLDTLEYLIKGASRRDTGHQHHDVLFRNLREQIIAEDELRVRVEFRMHDIHGLVRIRGEEALLGQLIREVRADHIRPLHADDGIDYRAEEIGSRQKTRNLLRLTASCLQGRHINVVVDVRMIRSEMPLPNLERRITTGSVNLCIIDFLHNASSF